METGIGSGSVYAEEKLFTDRDEANERAGQLAAAACEARIEQNEKQNIGRKRKSRRKPTWEARRIRELEKQVAALEQGNLAGVG